VSRRIAGLAVVVALWLIALPLASGEAGVCTCATSRETNGWCEVHEFGYIGGVKVTSRWLYEYIDAHGHALNLTTFTCPECRAAIASGGFCETHHLGFVNKMGYFSRLTYELGKAEAKPPSAIACRTCRKNAQTHGWCAKSGVGMIGPFAIRNRQDFDLAEAALERFMIANEASKRCNYCAGAILTDSECPVCKIRYKDGKVMANAGVAAAAHTSP
jgi:hypothetical protein